MKKIIFMIVLNCACMACPMESKQGYVVISLEEGMRIPLVPNLSGDFFSLEGESELELYVKRPIYLYVDDENMRFSLDGEEWKDFMKFFTGNVSTHACEGGLGVTAELNHRE